MIEIFLAITVVSMVINLLLEIKYPGNFKRSLQWIGGCIGVSMKLEISAEKKDNWTPEEFKLPEGITFTHIQEIIRDAHEIELEVLLKAFEPLETQIQRIESKKIRGGYQPLPTLLDLRNPPKPPPRPSDFGTRIRAASKFIDAVEQDAMIRKLPPPPRNPKPAGYSRPQIDAPYPELIENQKLAQIKLAETLAAKKLPIPDSLLADIRNGMSFKYAAWRDESGTLWGYKFGDEQLFLPSYPTKDLVDDYVEFW